MYNTLYFTAEGTQGLRLYGVLRTCTCSEWIVRPPNGQVAQCSRKETYLSVSIKVRNPNELLRLSILLLRINTTFIDLPPHSHICSNQEIEHLQALVLDDELA